MNKRRISALEYSLVCETRAYRRSVRTVRALEHAAPGAMLRTQLITGVAMPVERVQSFARGTVERHAARIAELVRLACADEDA